MQLRHIMNSCVIDCGWLGPNYRNTLAKQIMFTRPFPKPL